MKRKRPASSSNFGAPRGSDDQRGVVSAAAEPAKDDSSSRRQSPSKSSKKKSKNNKAKHPLNGLTLAVTTLDKKRTGRDGDNRNDDASCPPSSSYKQTIDTCKECGATITRQVHKRVNALIVGDAAVQNATQRVRKAIKLCIPIVDAGWIRACADSGTRVDWAEYLRDDEAKEAAEAKKAASAAAAADTASADGCDVKFDISAADANAASGWSEPVELDCCCVCHENGDLECPWCTGEEECNLTQRRLGKS